MNTQTTHLIREKANISRKDSFLVSMAETYGGWNIKESLIDFLSFCSKEYDKSDKSNISFSYSGNIVNAFIPLK